MTRSTLLPASVLRQPIIWSGGIAKRNIACDPADQCPALFVSVGVDEHSSGITVRLEYPDGGRYMNQRTLLSSRWLSPLTTPEECLQQAIRALLRVAEDQGWVAVK